MRDIIYVRPAVSASRSLIAVDDKIKAHAFFIKFDFSISNCYSLALEGLLLIITFVNFVKIAIYL